MNALLKTHWPVMPQQVTQKPANPIFKCLMPSWESPCDSGIQPLT